MSVADASALPDSVYRQPGFVPFLISRVLAMFAVQILAVVVARQVYDMTRDPLSLAYVGAAVRPDVPAADACWRPDRSLRSQAHPRPELGARGNLRGGAAVALAEWRAVLSFYIVLVFYGCARAFTGPALSSLLPQIVPRERPAAAIAANSMIVRGSTIAGPVFGGGLYAMGGGGLTYAACLLFFLAAIVLLQRVPVRYGEPMRALEATAWQRFTAGIRFIRSRPIILGTISLDLFAVLLGGVVALLPIYAQEVLEVGPTGLGALRSAMALGEVMVGFYLSTRPFNRHVGMTMFIAVAVFGLANMVFALSSLFWLSFAALFVAGGADMVSMYIRSSLIQFSTPDAMRGRVNAVNMLFIGSSNELGEFAPASVPPGSVRYRRHCWAASARWR